MSTNGDICVQNGVRIPSSELVIKACRASGAGGQHVNKTSTKVQITWHLLSSFALDDEQKQRLTERLRNRINKAGFITCSVDETRSQSKNIELAKERLAEMIKKALFVPKIRKATKPSKGSKERRLKAKKQRGQIKAQRKQKHWD